MGGFVIPFERERTLAEARARMEAHLAGRGWTVDLQTVGADLVTTVCTIRQTDGEIVASGNGKGTPEMAEVGAIYEAVEHYYGKWENADLCVTCVRAHEILLEPRFAVLPCVSELHAQADRRLACTSYQDVSSGATIRVPLFLVFPHYVGGKRFEGDDFNYTAVNRFGSSSGTAIGATFAEATVHALHELVERDAWSLFLLSQFFETHPGRRIGSLVAPNTLPEHLRRLLTVAEVRAKREIFLVDVTSDLGIPTFCATVDRLLPHEHVHPLGFGTSSYPLYAAYRAISELLQIADLKEHLEHARSLDWMNLQAAAPYSRLRDCVYFKVDPDRLDRRPWDYAPPPRGSLGDLLSRTVALLEENAIDLCFHVHREVPGLFCVVSYISMALERFFLVSSGLPMAPGPRGMRLFAERPVSSGRDAGHRETDQA